jgi:hypothetical protein
VRFVTSSPPTRTVSFAFTRMSVAAFATDRRDGPVR